MNAIDNEYIELTRLFLGFKGAGYDTNSTLSIQRYQFAMDLFTVSDVPVKGPVGIVFH
jgi:hypothetical protein